MNAQQLRNSILQQAIQGKLVPQDPNDEPASVLLQRIRKEKEHLVKEGQALPVGRQVKKKDLESKPIEEDEIPFEIPESWEWVRLQYLCTRFSTGPFGTMVHKEDYVDLEGHPLVNPTNIKNGKIVVEGIKKVSNTKYKELGSYVLQTNDLVLARRGDLSKIAIVTEKENGWLAGTGAFFMHFLDGLFLPYFIVLYSSFYCQSYLLDQSVGGTMNNLNQKLLSDFLLPLPPLAEQRRIVAKIEELMPLVERYGKAQQALDQLNESLPARLRQSILQEAIQGRLVPQDPREEPASELLRRIRKEKEQLVKEGQALPVGRQVKKKDLESKPIEEDEIPFEIPESWEWCRFSDLYWQLTDGTHSTPKYKDHGVPFLSVKDMSGGKLSFSNTKFISSEEHTLLSQRCHPQKGDLLISKVGTTGIPLIIDTDREFSIFVSLALIKFFPHLLDSSFLLFLINSPLVQSQVKENTRGVGNKNWVLAAISNTIMVLPPLSEQKRIVAKVEELFGILKEVK